MLLIPLTQRHLGMWYPMLLSMPLVAAKGGRMEAQEEDGALYWAGQLQVNTRVAARRLGHDEAITRRAGDKEKRDTASFSGSSSTRGTTCTNYTST